ncbi:MAG: peptidyl-prolyl cis-trans isomerase [Candidatus Aminicenantes bacterium]|nr:peptidyl-prolyl cis-trans isomerase [Candidatus Aminicenantes bacterium]
MKKLLGIIFIAALIFAQNYELVDEVVAIVGDEVITLSEVKEYENKIKQFLATRYKGAQLEEIFQQERAKLLDNLIDQKLLLVKAKQEGITADEDLKIAMKNMASQYGFSTIQELEAAMAKQGINVDEWKKDALKNLIQQKLIQKEIDMNIKVTEGEIRSYYEEHINEYTTPASWELRVIKIEKSPEAKKKKAEVDRIIQEKGFEEATKLSAPPFNENGGFLGKVSKEEIRKEFLEAIKGKSDGYISPWIDTPDGWFKLKIEKYHPSFIKKLKDVRKDIEKKIFNQKRQEKVKEFVEQLRKEIYVKVIRKYPA